MGKVIQQISLLGVGLFTLSTLVIVLISYGSFAGSCILAEECGFDQYLREQLCLWQLVLSPAYLAVGFIAFVEFWKYLACRREERFE